VKQDLHLGSLTVRETLTFAAARLRLSKVVDSVVGDSFNKGISGGQLKRLSIGVETFPSPR
jgi:ABC-type multidrug transport system ATPase subunit|tara:strand:- start:528 stop:710 length:183 start_codon:yes stop_codon:yes gene_type:complete